MQTCRYRYWVRASLAAATLLAALTPVIAQPCDEQWLPGPERKIAGVDGPVYSLTTWDPDGPGPRRANVITTGAHTAAGTERISNIARWDPDLNAGEGDWTAMGALEGSIGYALGDWDPDGAGPHPPVLVVGGGFDTADGEPAGGVAWWDHSSADPVVGRWRPLGTTFDWAGALTVWPGEQAGNDVLIAGGSISIAPGQSEYFVARWDPAAKGGQGDWITIGAHFDDIVRSVVTWDPDGGGPSPSTLVVGGFFEMAGTTAVNRIAYWDGSPTGGSGQWRSFGSGMDRDIYSVCLWDPDGDGPLPRNIVACGDFRSAGGNSAIRVARWDQSANSGSGAWHPFGAGLSRSVWAVIPWDPDGSGPILPQVVASNPASLNSRNMHRWDPGSGADGEWISFEVGIDRSVTAMTAWDHDSLAETPDRLVAGGQTYDAGPVAAYNVAYWEPQARGNDGTWCAFGTGVNRIITAMHTWDPDDEGPQPATIVAGGTFAFGNPPANYIATWNGRHDSGWTPLGGALTGANDWVHRITTWRPGPDGSPARLVVAGEFTEIDGFPTNRIAWWEPQPQAGLSPWRPFGSGMDRTVTCIVSGMPTAQDQPHPNLWRADTLISREASRRAASRAGIPPLPMALVHGSHLGHCQGTLCMRWPRGIRTRTARPRPPSLPRARSGFPARQPRSTLQGGIVRLAGRRWAVDSSTAFSRSLFGIPTASDQPHRISSPPVISFHKKRNTPTSASSVGIPNRAAAGERGCPSRRSRSRPTWSSLGAPQGHPDRLIASSPRGFSAEDSRRSSESRSGIRSHRMVPARGNRSASACGGAVTTPPSFHSPSGTPTAPADSPRASLPAASSPSLATSSPPTTLTTDGPTASAPATPMATTP